MEIDITRLVEDADNMGQYSGSHGTTPWKLPLILTLLLCQRRN